jgi:hypothetical protein
MEGAKVCIVLHLAIEVLEEFVGGMGKRTEVCVVIPPLGQGIDDGVEATRMVVDGEIIAKELAHPLVLRHSG